MTPQQALMKDARPPHTPSSLSADADATVTGTDIVCLAGLQPQPVEWLSQDRLAAGTLAMLSGEPGSGKTWVAPRHRGGTDPRTRPVHRRKAQTSHRPLLPGGTRRLASHSTSLRRPAPKTENQVPGRGLCPLRRISAIRSTRQDAQMNCLSTLSIFVKQTTYLATLPNPNFRRDWHFA